MKTIVLLVLALGTGCAPYYVAPGRYYGGDQRLRVQNEEAGVEANGWTTGNELPTVTTSSATATATVLDARTRRDVGVVSVRTDDYVGRRGADLPHAMHASRAAERERLTSGLAAQQAACAARFADGHESVTCMVLNQQVVAVLQSGQGFYMPNGGSWMGGGGYYPVSAIRTAAAIQAARRFQDARRRGVTPYGASGTSGEAVDSEAREAIGALQTTVEEHVQEGGE